MSDPAYMPTRGDTFRIGNVLVCVHEIWNGQVLYERHFNGQSGLFRMPLEAFNKAAKYAERFTLEEARERFADLLVTSQ